MTALNSGGRRSAHIAHPCHALKIGQNWPKQNFSAQPVEKARFAEENRFGFCFHFL
jgi:hypothetical protein